MSASALLTAGVGGFGTISRVVLVGFAPSFAATNVAFDPRFLIKMPAGGTIVAAPRFTGRVQ